MFLRILLLSLCAVFASVASTAAATRLTPAGQPQPTLRNADLTRDAIMRARELQFGELGYSVEPKIRVLASSLQSAQRAKDLGLQSVHTRSPDIQVVVVELTEQDGSIWIADYFYDPKTHLLQSEKVKQVVSPRGAKQSHRKPH